MLLWAEKSSASFCWPLAAAAAPPIMLATSRQLAASFFTQLAGGDSYVAVWDGFYKRGCQVKTLYPSQGGFVFLGIQPLLATPTRLRSRCSRHHAFPGSHRALVRSWSGRRQAARWQHGQPWFYLRLAPWRGTMALLGCPREHTVAHETYPPIPPRILTLEPVRAASPTSERQGYSFRLGGGARLCCL